MAEQYKCENCGGTMVFDAASQKLKCPNCDNEIEIIGDKDKVEIHNLGIDDMRTHKADKKETTTLECTGCGARIEIAGHETSATCPYCDSTYVVAKEQQTTLNPDAVIPFKVDKNELGKKFADWMKGKWLAPGELKNLYQRDQFAGFYIPYWTFDADADCKYTAMGGRDKQVKYKDSDGTERTRTETDWYHTSGRINKDFKDVKTPASERYKKGLFKGVEPYDFKGLVPYSADYFSGYMSENYTIDLNDGHKDAINQMESELKSMAGADVRKRYDQVKDVRISATFRNEKYKYLMLPVYATTYAYKDKNYTVLINGQSGKIYGEYPKSPVKIIAIIVAIVAVIALLCSLGKAKNKKDTAMDMDSSSYVAYETEEATVSYEEIKFDDFSVRI